MGTSGSPNELLRGSSLLIFANYRCCFRRYFVTTKSPLPQQTLLLCGRCSGSAANVEECVEFIPKVVCYHDHQITVHWDDGRRPRCADWYITTLGTGRWQGRLAWLSRRQVGRPTSIPAVASDASVACDCWTHHCRGDDDDYVGSRGKCSY